MTKSEELIINTEKLIDLFSILTLGSVLLVIQLYVPKQILSQTWELLPFVLAAITLLSYYVVSVYITLHYLTRIFLDLSIFYQTHKTILNLFGVLLLISVVLFGLYYAFPEKIVETIVNYIVPSLFFLFLSILLFILLMVLPIPKNWKSKLWKILPLPEKWKLKTSILFEKVISLPKNKSSIQ